MTAPAAICSSFAARPHAPVPSDGTFTWPKTARRRHTPHLLRAQAVRSDVLGAGPASRGDPLAQRYSQPMEALGLEAARRLWFSSPSTSSHRSKAPTS